jgi:hypothetical protein
MFHRRTCESKMWTIGDCGKQSVTLVTSLVQIQPFQLNLGNLQQYYFSNNIYKF